ncbi:hypothetical protein MGU_11668 [Metarhizium guizhouense ARSEF 977]|uniref:NACHT-NTPase and P-loop NTPases N-terminal domain-containing protein n=1 Tax=Metarhizium guizhouense (strain ARSEF 977) TaxID=1276136 RepID=A0A0B4GMK2_METGA|nr:hypothetical protein MGU_11668 [Metarhizium guizhouense ARSEF 977]
MDPLTALGVASNVVAFIDFAWTLIKDAREISTSGANEGVASIKSLFQNASTVNNKLASLPPIPPELQLMITESKKMATEIMDALKTLAAPQDQSKWASFLVALRGIWTKPKVQDLLDRLDSKRRSHEPLGNHRAARSQQQTTPSTETARFTRAQEGFDSGRQPVSQQRARLPSGDHDSLSTMQRRLETFPRELDAFFHHLIESVDTIYRRQTARYFSVALLADGPMSAVLFSFLDHVDVRD